MGTSLQNINAFLGFSRVLSLSFLQDITYNYVGLPSCMCEFVIFTSSLYTPLLFSLSIYGQSEIFKRRDPRRGQEKKYSLQKIKVLSRIILS